MHLTNYSVNKHNENFSRDEDIAKGSKRLSFFFFSDINNSIFVNMCLPDFSIFHGLIIMCLSILLCQDRCRF